MSRKNPHPTRQDLEAFDDESTGIGEGPFGDDLPEDDEDLDLEGMDDLEGLEGLDDLEDFEDERTIPGHPIQFDSFEDSQVDSPSRVVLDPRSQVSGKHRNPLTAAQELSQGPWRERAFIPRGVVPKEQILQSMEQAVQIAAVQKGVLERVRAALRAELMPLLRQVVEQAGGDGFDAWVAGLRAPPGGPGKDALLWNLAGHMERFNRAQTQQELVGETKKLCHTSKQALLSPVAKKLSLKLLEEEFEGRIEVDTVLSILFASAQDLEARKEQVERTLDAMRTQMRGLPGSSPQGLMWNFSRLKVEKRVVEAEEARRG